jgi:glycogen synthase
VRILLTTDVLGGVWSYTEELTDALIARGHEVVLVSFGGEPQRPQREWLAGRPRLEYLPLSYPLEWMLEPEPGLTDSGEALHRIVRRTAPDIVHLNQYYYGALDLGVPKLVVAHSDVVSWWRAARGEDAPAGAWLDRYRSYVRKGLRGADLRVAPSRWMAGRIQEIYDPAEIGVVHNARSPDRFSFVAAARSSSVVTVGRLWDEGKGALDLARAAALLNDSCGRSGRCGPDIVAAGPARHPSGGADFPTDAPGLRWAGVLPAAELIELLGRASVYVATSRYEPFGLAPLEAALSGCALVMTDIPTFRELWDGAAAFYAPGDVPALTALVRDLLADATRRDALAGAARSRAIQRFTPGRMAGRYEALYRRLIDAPCPLNIGPAPA